jgi:lipopolysaccharide/colanic/teichoic acid biosynthesis glycosyltransferase
VDQPATTVVSQLDLFVPSRTAGKYQIVIKRALDVTVSLLLLIICAPIFVLVAGLVRFSSPGPVLFAQERVGKDGKLFCMYKFRTMFREAESAVHRAYYVALIRGQAQPVGGKYKLVDDPRITPAGRLLRRFSLDELPQLINILRGDMSLVGPRPPIPYEVDLYTSRERARLMVAPGLTGLWQVSGRSLLDFDDMVRLDLMYIERWSLWSDLVILLRTPRAVLTARGAD